MWHRRAFPPADLLPCRRQDVGCYVDNLQIAHSVELDDNGRGPAGCAYNTFMDALNREWKVVDEGPMEDLLGIEVDYLEDGAIKLHQSKYVQKMVEWKMGGRYAEQLQQLLDGFHEARSNFAKRST